MEGASSSHREAECKGGRAKEAGCRFVSAESVVNPLDPAY